MADLPIPPSSPVPAAASRSGTSNSLNESSARADSAQTNEEPFQAVLAQELGQHPDDKARTKGSAANSADGTDPQEDTAPAAATADAAPVFLLGNAPLLAASEVASNTMSANAGAHGARGFAAAQHRLANAALAAAADTTSPALAAEAVTADFAAPGKIGQPSPGELRQETAFTPGVLEKPLTSPAIAVAMHSGSGASAPATQPAAVARLEARVGASDWDKGLGDKLVWMAGQRHQVAQLHLNPPDLGPLKITLTLNNDQASAQFFSAHAVVREAVESAMPRLREMLAESGIFLGQASVSAESFREQAQPQAQHQPRGYATSTNLAGVDSGFEQRGARQLRPSLGLVDTFA